MKDGPVDRSRRRALDAWARKLESIIRPVDGGNVVTLPVAARE